MADIDSRSLDDAGLGARMRGLPLHEPAPDLWNEIASQLPPSDETATRHRRWHRVIALAVAAGLAIAALLPWSMKQTTAPIPVQSSALSAQASADLGWLRTRSGQLEQWLGNLPTAPHGNGGDLMATVEVEDLIALVDLQLDASRNAREALPLWRQRVALLETLSLLRSAPYRVVDTVDKPTEKPLTLHRL
ncbi:MAG: hypothetical protein WBP11_12600 [Dokdonella sp.]